MIRAILCTLAAADTVVSCIKVIMLYNIIVIYCTFDPLSTSSGDIRVNGYSFLCPLPLYDHVVIFLWPLLYDFFLL